MSCDDCRKPKGPTCPHCGELLELHPQPVPWASLMPPLDHSKRRGWVGMTRMGKSACLKAVLAYWQAQAVDHVVWDPADEHTQSGKEREDECRRGHVRMRLTVSEFLERIDADERFFTDPGLSLAVVPDRESSSAKYLAEQLALWLPMVRARRKVRLVLEETGLYANKAVELLYDVFANWAKEKIGVEWVGQRWTMLDVAPRSQTTDMVTARQVEKPDLRIIAEKAGRPFACAMSRLPKGGLLHRDFCEVAADAFANL